jgi:hypothetical protein
MKPVNKKDMPKLIALIGLTICSLGYGVFQLVGGTSVAAPPPASEKKDEKKDNAAAGTPQASASVVADDPLIAQLQRLEGVSDPVLVRDPFMISGGGTATPAPGAPVPGIATPSQSEEERRRDLAQTHAIENADRLKDLLGINIRPKKPKDGGFMDGSQGRTGGLPGASGSTHLVLPPPPLPQPPALVVTGILIPESGNGESVAMVRINEHSRWLSVGDSVGNGFVVRSIRRTERGRELEIVDSSDPKNIKRQFTYPVN